MANSFTLTPPAGAESGFKNVDPKGQMTMIIIEKNSGAWGSSDVLDVNGVSVPFSTLSTKLKIPYDFDNIPATGTGSDVKPFDSIGNISSTLNTGEWKFMNDTSIQTALKDNGSVTTVNGTRFPHNTGNGSGTPVNNDTVYPAPVDGSWAYLIGDGSIKIPITITNPDFKRIVGHKVITKKKTCFGEDGSQTTYETQEIFDVYQSAGPNPTLSLVPSEGLTQVSPCDVLNASYVVTPKNSNPSPL